jgi:tetratricopeptide (TPR) repeat protein
VIFGTLRSVNRNQFPRPNRRQLIIAVAGVVALGAAGYGAARWLTYRTIEVCVVSDYAFRQQHANWTALLDARFAAVNRIFRGSGVRWAFRDAAEPDPTGKLDRLEERRQKLSRTQCQADVILGITSRPGGPAAADAPPFAHTAMLADNPSLSEEQNIRLLAQGMAMLFGAPKDAPGAGTLMTQPPESDRIPKAAVRLIGRLADFDFSKGAEALDGVWSDRVFRALVVANRDRAGNPERAARRTIAMSLAAEQAFSKAIPHMREAVKLDPDNAAGRVELATMYTHNSQPAEAVAEYREVVRLQPGSAGTHAGLAAALASQGKGEEAIEEFRAALAINPKFAMAQVGMAHILSQQLGRIDEAIAAYRVAMDMNPDLPAAAQGLSRAQSFKERWRLQTADQRRKALAAPSSHAAQVELGLAEARAGNVAPAVKAFRRALELDPTDGRARTNLAVLLYVQKDYTGALRELVAARETGFEPPAALVERVKRKAEQ